jgi:UDP-N-acetylmuramate--alanine ligase
MSEIKLNEIKKVYVIGIKGSGVIAVVEILHAMGIAVSGSDTAEKFFTDGILKRLEISYFEKFSAGNVPADADLIIYSTAYNENNNVELDYARKNRLPMVSYPEVLAALFNQKMGLAVCGTHGKTTTSAWLANTLKECGLDPQAAIGSKVVNWGGNALSGKGDYFVAETDEYQNKLSLYEPKGAILTSCDWDHPDYFETFAGYKKVFKDFVERLPKTGFLVAFGDSTDTLEVADSCPADTLTYGVGEDCDFQIADCRLEIAKEDQSRSEIDSPAAERFNLKNQAPDNKLTQSFEVIFRNKSLGKFEIQLPGKHNILNATAVIAVCHKLRIDMEQVRQALKKFRGTARRFEYVGTRNGAILIDDYGHHPEEIKATLKAAREIYPEKNIWAVFHPHTFTRTLALLAEFSQSFGSADKVIVLDIYGSARETQGGVHSEDLVKLINKYDYSKAEYIPTIDQAVEHLKDKIGSEDVVIAIGAGNGWEVVEDLKR